MGNFFKKSYLLQRDRLEVSFWLLQITSRRVVVWRWRVRLRPSRDRPSRDRLGRSSERTNKISAILGVAAVTDAGPFAVIYTHAGELACTAMLSMYKHGRRALWWSFVSVRTEERCVRLLVIWMKDTSSVNPGKRRDLCMRRSRRARCRRECNSLVDGWFVYRAHYCLAFTRALVYAHRMIFHFFPLPWTRRWVNLLIRHVSLTIM